MSQSQNWVCCNFYNGYWGLAKVRGFGIIKLFHALVVELVDTLP